MSAKRRLTPHHSSTKSKLKHAQRGGSSTVVLLLVLLLVAGTVAFLYSQMDKFKSGRSEGIIVESNPDDVMPPTTDVAPTESKKKGFLGGLFDKKETVAPTEVPEAKVTTPPTPTPIVRALPKGEQSFTITQGKEMTGPLFVKGVVSNFATAKNIKQTVTIFFDKSRPPESVSATLQTDTKLTPITFTKKADQQGLEVWTGEWMLDDTNNVNMAMNFEATNQAGKSIAGVAVR